MEFTAAMAAAAVAVEKEHMFDKVVTPSDVGKLNRLVIPKQHAEKFFPLGGGGGGDKGGLLLSFEDRAGKPWGFRYSYWNSSQSYVMTKGWSRFVKEKRLDAGDTISFGRGVGETARGRLFIDWRRRPDVAAAAPPSTHRLPLPSVPFAPPWGHPGRMFQLPPWTPIYDPRHRRHVHPVGYDGGFGPASRQVLLYSPQQHHHHHHPAAAAVVLDSVPVHIAAAGHAEPLVASGSKRVRLFGVNLECADSDEDFSGGRLPPPPPPPSSGKARCSLNLDL